MSKSGSISRKSIDRSRSLTCFALPAQASPILRERLAPTNPPQWFRVGLGTRRYGAVEGTVCSPVLNAAQAGSGHCKSKAGNASPLATPASSRQGPVINPRSEPSTSIVTRAPRRRDERHVTAELNAIAQSLFAVEQDGLSRRCRPHRARSALENRVLRFSPMEPCGAIHTPPIHARNRRDEVRKALQEMKRRHSPGATQSPDRNSPAPHRTASGRTAWRRDWRAPRHNRGARQARTTAYCVTRPCLRRARMISAHVARRA